MKITFEPATPDDAEALVRAQVAAFHDDARLYPGEPEDGPPGYDSVAVMLRKIGQGAVTMIVVDGQIVGDIIVYDEGEGTYLLDVLAIDPAYHNKGIGTLAMLHIEKVYPAKKWILDTPGYAVRNQHFYEKFGYVRVGEQQMEGFTLLAYEKYT